MAMKKRPSKVPISTTSPLIAERRLTAHQVTADGGGEA